LLGSFAEVFALRSKRCGWVALCCLGLSPLFGSASALATFALFLGSFLRASLIAFSLALTSLGVAFFSVVSAAGSFFG